VNIVKSLVVYYSRTGNAKFVAETVAAELGADIEEIVDKKSRAGKLGWVSAGRDGMQGRETQIEPTKLVPADYDIVVVGTPVWAWSPCAAIRTWMGKNDLARKKVALFFTMDSNLKQAIEKTKALAPNAVFVGELTIAEALKDKGVTSKKIADWCGTLKATG
jgi:flavodoxin